VQIRWPDASGTIEEHVLAADTLWQVTQGQDPVPRAQ
jgi:hypothetical protein